MPWIGGDEISAAEGESDAQKIARLEREKEAAEARERAALEELEELKKKNRMGLFSYCANL